MTDLDSAFKAFITNDNFPCVGAKAALSLDHLKIFLAAGLNDSKRDIEIYEAVIEFSNALERDLPIVQSLAVIFSDPDYQDEKTFEKAMWNRLQALHNLDVASGNSWAEEASADPDNPHFSFSLASEPYFIVGMHPAASRPARRFSHPALVFNSHDQFERMREDGRYQKMQRIIRERENDRVGHINPMLADFGNSSEARQYSGRRVEESWKAPLEVKEPKP